MKKLIIAGLAAAIACGAFAQQNAPAFDDPKASVIAVSSAAVPGKMKDNIKLINLSDDENISFRVYIYDSKKASWNLYGRALLKEFYDGDTIDSDFEDKIRKVEYVAVVPDGNGAYRYEAEKKHNDLYIKVYSPDGSIDESYKKDAATVDVRSVPGGFKDNVKFVSETSDKNISFMLYAFNDKNGAWQKAGVAVLKGFGDTDTVDSPLEDSLPSYAYFAVVSRSGKTYAYDFKKANKDFIITVR